MKAFVPSLDSTCLNVKEVESLIIAPLFGHDHLDGKANLVGVIQCVNKTGNGLITPHDIVSKWQALI